MRTVCFLTLATVGVAYAQGEREVRELLAAALPNELLHNGNFEAGAEDWFPATGMEGQPIGEPAGDKGTGFVTGPVRTANRALRLDARGLDHEVDVISSSVPITGGATYVLSSYVVALGGGTTFKVTLDWADADSKHIQYDNDWAGYIAPNEFAFHGGAFRAPKNATQVRVLLGVAAGAAYVFDDISLRPLGPLVRVGSFGSSRAVHEPGDDVTLTATVGNEGGSEAHDVQAILRCPEGFPTPRQPIEGGLGSLPIDGSATLVWDFEKVASGVFQIVLEVIHTDGKPARRDAFIVVAERPAKLPEVPITTASFGNAIMIRSGSAALIFPQVADGFGPAWLFIRQDDRWVSSGVLRSLGELVVQTNDGEREAFLIKAYGVSTEGDGLDFTASLSDSDGAQWSATVRFEARPGAEDMIDCSYELSCNRPRKVLAFRGPMLFLGDGSFLEQKHSAVFCGLEFLAADEMSSDTKSVAPPKNRRYAVHPYKVTAPFMSLAHEGKAVTLEWDPLQRWDGEHFAPTALFASPDRFLGQQNHLMGLQIPTIPQWADENEPEAHTPYALPKGAKLVLKATIRVVDAPQGAVDAVADWFHRHGVCPAPREPGSMEEGAHFCAEGFDRAWHDDKKGWEHTSTGPVGFDYSIASFLMRYVANWPDAPQVESVRRHLRDAMAATSGRRGTELAFMTGSPSTAAQEARNQVAGLIASQREDGSWPFEPDEKRASLGPRGATELGICAEPCLNLLRAARVFGDKGAFEAGLKGLAYIDQHFVRPAGGETWEVPLYAPNLRAAALAVEAFVEAYRLTGEQHCLDRARYWAYSGLPFIYQWHAPDREIMSYASISVFGATFHTGLWFGNAVQWVGLVYAQALQELAEFDDSFPWADVARGITISAMQQQKTDKDTCGHVGYYPDSYTPVGGKETYHWCLAPVGIAQNILFVLDIPLTVKTKIVRHGMDYPLFVSSIAKIRTAEMINGSLRLKVSDVPEERCYVLISFLSQPEGVRLGGDRLDPMDDLSAPACWHWDVVTKRLVIRIPGRDAESDVVVEGVQALEDPGLSLKELANGGFEFGMSGWSTADTNFVQVVDAPGRGGKAVALDARAVDVEAQLNSALFIVEPNVDYRLSSWVMETDGDKPYKVTIDWRTKSGAHIRYDNDWQGTNHPTDFTPHGGVFHSPENAEMASVILGVRAGSRCLFDDIKLEQTEP